MSKNATIAIDAGTLYTPNRTFSPARIIIDGGSIAEVGGIGEIRIPPGAQHIDSTPFIVAPGFIEPHIHGCGGADVMEGSYEALNAVTKIVARHGTTSFLATTVSSPAERLTEAVEKLGELLSLPFEGAQPLGIHMEGPFLNPLKRGTHKREHIGLPDPNLLHEWIQASDSNIRMITIAPELDRGGALARLAASYGVRLAMGHSNASFEEASEAADRGVCYAVHTFNAMREFSHRDPGITGAVLADDRIFAEIIADGIHVHPSVARVLARSKGSHRVVLATDAISATDMPDGAYVLGPDTVYVTNGVCRDSEGRLAGSTLTQELALKNFSEWSSLPLSEALRAVTQNPATALGLSTKGILEPGMDADLVVLDTDFHVLKTFVAGKLVFERG